MRIQIDLDESGEALFNELKVLTGLSQHKDLFNNAITLFDWAVTQRMRGLNVAALDEQNKTYKEVLMPALVYAANLPFETKRAALYRRGISLPEVPAEVPAFAAARAVAAEGHD